MNDVKIISLYDFCPSNDPDSLALFENSNELYGYINKEGDIVIPPVFSYATDFHRVKGKLRAVVTVHNLLNELFYRLIDENGKVLSGLYDEIKIEGDLIIARRGSKWGTLDIDGKVKNYFIFDEIKNGVGVIKHKNGKYKGLVQYFYITDNGIIMAQHGKPSSRCGFMTTEYSNDYSNTLIRIDKKGNPYFDPLLMASVEDEVYVNLSTDDYLSDYNPITGFELVKYKGKDVYRALAIKKGDKKEECIIDEKGNQIISYPRDKYTIEKSGYSVHKVIEKDFDNGRKLTKTISVRNNMYVVTNKENKTKCLYDAAGNMIINFSIDIDILSNGLILVRDLKNVPVLYNSSGILLSTFVDWTNIYGDVNSKYLVATYMDNGKVKSEIISSLGNIVNFGFDYDTAEEFINGYSILEKEEIDYSMNNPYKYYRQYIVNDKKQVISSYPKENVLDSFYYIESFANEGFFIAEYENKEEFAIIDLNGNIKWTKSAQEYNYVNGMLIFKSEINDNQYYEIYDSDGNNIFESEYFDNIYFDYDSLSDEVTIAKNSDEYLYIVSDDGRKRTLDDFKHLESFTPLNKYYYVVKRLGFELNNKNKILSSIKSKNKTNLDKFMLLNKRKYMIEVDNIDKLCTNEIDEEGNRYLSIIDDIKECLEYFDLSKCNFKDVDVRGIDFSKTNAKLNPKEVYMHSLDYCILKYNNLSSDCKTTLFAYDTSTKDYQLAMFAFDTDVSLKGTIIDGKIINGDRLRTTINNDDLSGKRLVLR